MNSLCFSHFLKKYIKNICVIKKIIVTLHSQFRKSDRGPASQTLNNAPTTGA